MRLDYAFKAFDGDYTATGTDSKNVRRTFLFTKTGRVLWLAPRGGTHVWVGCPAPLYAFAMVIRDLVFDPQEKMDV